MRRLGGGKSQVNRLLRALMLLVVLASLLVAGVSYAILAEIRRPADPEAVEPVEFEILPGQSATEIASSLEDLNLIRQPLLFRLMLREREAGDQLKVGTYQLSPTMTMGEIISALQVAPSFEETEFQTIEGMRMEEVAQVIVDAGLAESTEAFLEVASDATPFKETHSRLADIPEGQGLEGYLFPSTYRIEATATITDVIEKMLTDGFDASYETFENQVIVENRNVHEIVTMASIVQREAANVDEMPHLAYIFWNRLKPENLAESGGLIGADPTVQYIVGYSEEEQTWWRKNLTQADLDTESPYNTRRVAGLPPGPIANPGLDALRAAARPGPLRPDGSEGKDDLYFVAKCGENAHNYATTLTEFSQYEQEYLNCPE
jgi:UPF0755 protein